MYDDDDWNDDDRDDDSNDDIECNDNFITLIVSIVSYYQYNNAYFYTLYSIDPSPSVDKKGVESISYIGDPYICVNVCIYSISDVMYYVTVVIGVELYHGTQKDPVILHKVNIMLYWRYLCGDLVCIVAISIQIAYWYTFNL